MPRESPALTISIERHEPLRAEAGVTLIEIMIVLAIIALIMGVFVGPAVFRQFTQAKYKMAWVEAKEFESAYAKWVADNEGTCPEKLEDLLRYTNKKDTKDPWGKPFVMVCGEGAPEEATEGFGVFSWGGDGKEGTADDVHSWDAKPKTGAK